MVVVVEQREQWLLEYMRFLAKPDVSKTGQMCDQAIPGGARQIAYR